MKRTLLLLILSATAVLAQFVPPPGVIQVTADPSGACNVGTSMRYNNVNGALWGCNGTWTQISGGGGGSAAWGSITGTLSSQTDLQTALNAKASSTAATTVNGQTCTLGSSCTIPLSAVNPQTATYQVLAADFSNYKTITVASGTFTITLVASGSQPAAGQYIRIVNYGSGVVTIARSGQNINGGTSSLTLGAGSATAPNSGTVISDGTNYFAAVEGTTNVNGVIASSFVTTSQSTTSTTFVDLGTPDTVTFTCSATCNFAVQYVTSNSDTTSNVVSCYNGVFIDSVQVDSGNQGATILAAGFAYGTQGTAAWKATSQAAGSHTVTIKHRVNNGNTCNWSERLLTILSVP